MRFVASNRYLNVLISVSFFVSLTTAWVTQQSSNKLHRYRSSDTKRFARSLVVVSPPGGVGEVAAVKAAELGSSVRWFVVSGGSSSAATTSTSTSTGDVVLSQEALNRIAAAGGTLELASATSSSLLLKRDEMGSALPVVSSWCGTADAIICTLDGIVDNRKKKDEEDPTIEWTNAVNLAAKEASNSIKGTKIAILPASDGSDVSGGEKSVGIGDVMSSLVGMKRLDVPSSLFEALGSSSSNLVIVRHGDLFGIPESSPDFSPFIGGPRRDPELCQEYAYSSVRVDSTIAVSGIRMSGTKTSRHAIGQAAALLATGNINMDQSDGLDVCISSQPGGIAVTTEDWRAEFGRVEKMMKQGEAALLFEAEYAAVPDTTRLADWLATKWAPAILRTYDIAAIRTGSRPVSAARMKNSDVAGLEIIWQQLVNFESVTSGRMIINVSPTGIKAIRGAGDPKAGFGTVSNKPLQGEDIMVRLLAEASSQAVEKGLAIKKEIVTVTAPIRVTPPTVVSSIQESGTRVADTTPRQSAARRSPERARGSKGKQANNNES